MWSKKCEEAFQAIKGMLSPNQVLAHYDPTLPLSLTADASAYSVGAVISQRCADGGERPIAFASQTLHWHGATCGGQVWTLTLSDSLLPSPVFHAKP